MYSLSVIAALGGENVFTMYAKVGTEEQTTSMLESGDFEKKGLNNIRITEGTAIVGFTVNSSSANWSDITNFELIKTENITSINKVSSSNLFVNIRGKAVSVISNEPVLLVCLSSINGKMLHVEKSVEKEVAFFLSQSGVYIL
ncbi:hypothetical protein EZS27_023645 [termite gut metagenome]|uniref:Uncharacterized protein n=1 Tax=termite gut metagenome TaxID=433724 RepID=A0A5J4QZR1_9ZZZZ